MKASGFSGFDGCGGFGGFRAYGFWGFKGFRGFRGFRDLRGFRGLWVLGLRTGFTNSGTLGFFLGIRGLALSVQTAVAHATCPKP